MKRLITIIIFAAIFSVTAFSQMKDNQHFKWKVNPSKSVVEKNEEFLIRVSLDFDKTWYTYSIQEQINEEGIGPSTTEIVILSDTKVKMTGKIKAPKPKVKYDSAFQMNIKYHKGKFFFDLPVKALEKLDFSRDEVKIELYIQQCDPTKCLPPMPFEQKVSADAFLQTEAEIKADEETETEEVTELSAETDTAYADEALAIADTAEAADEIQESVVPEEYMTDSEKEIKEKKEQGIWAFLLFAMTNGALALLTPCVFPMVPITVSFFTKRAEKKAGRGLVDSTVYALGIIFTFTALGFVFALLFGSTGIQDFAANPWVNMAIATLFIVFALNLFGAFEIRMPTGLMNKLHTKSQGGGMLGVLLMGLTFSLTSFTCTVPFVGSAILSATGGEWFYPIIGMLGFATVFAAPFFLLALFPSALNKMPKSGGWMNNVKVVMGFLEIAAAIKFISNADLVWRWGIMSPEMFLAIWIGCGLLIVVYVLGFFRLKHDSPVESVGTPRVLFAIFFTTITIYLFAGLFGNSLGELKAFLPPPNYSELMSGQATASTGFNPTNIEEGHEKEELSWHSDYQTALAEAKKLNKPLFIDFTGVTCTNCRLMETEMFPRKSIKNLMSKMVRVRLFTDRRNELDLANRQLQLERFKSIELPLYVILTPNESLVATKSFTRDEPDFVAFMQKGLDAVK